jgi:esterase FrsA
MKRMSKIPHIACLFALAAFTPAILAQSWGPRPLDELKQETQRRADRNAPPVSGVKPDDVRAALAQIQNLEPDTWASAFIRVGDQHAAHAKAVEATAPAEARELYHRAWETYNLGRWPTENSNAKKQAYAKALDAFAAYGKLMEPPIEIVRIPYEGKEIVGYLRLPKARPAPLVFGISGLDSRKEDVAAGSDTYIRNGIAVFAVDMPGTGQAPVKVDVGAEHMFSKALDHLLTRPEIDGKRVVVQGRSWSGYWAATLAYTERARLRGAVVQGGPIHAYFTPEWQNKALTTREYLFDLFPARSAIYEVKTMEDFLAYGPRMSLLSPHVPPQPRHAGPAVSAHARRQRRAGHAGSNRRPVSADETRRSERGVGQSGRRAHGTIPIVVQPRHCTARRDALDTAHARPRSADRSESLSVR